MMEGPRRLHPANPCAPLEFCQERGSDVRQECLGACPGSCSDGPSRKTKGESR
jgi:hypothetical protein